jgi:peptidoglycan/xylan/chitin deacetylase (PgdA/CDA1 family)
MSMNSAKAVLRDALTVPGLAAPFAVLRRGRAVIFMLHRFRQAEIGIEGHDPSEVRRGLEYLRRKRYELVPLTEVFERLGGRGRPLDRSVAFTMDDGYLDQATVAGPIFADFDCPVTTFVSTGFLDGRLWFWWDRIEHVFRQTSRRRIRVRLGSGELSYTWADPAGRTRAQFDFIERCKEVPDREKEAGIGRLAAEAQVEIAGVVPARYAPMSWDQLRECEKRGMSFGPHTVTHPVLGRTAPEDSHGEIVDSWERLRTEAQRPVPVFCYPNGRWGDFGSREVAVLKATGFKGAVVGEPGYADLRDFQRDEDGPFRVRRFSYPESLAEVIQFVSGAERFKQILRREA